jgi:hypothetical protein
VESGESIMAEIGEPDRVVRRERETEPKVEPVLPQTAPELEPAR